jgi:hypothetical protein
MIASQGAHQGQPYLRSTRRLRPPRPYTPTPDGFERFLRESVGLPMGETTTDEAAASAASRGIPSQVTSTPMTPTRVNPITTKPRNFWGFAFLSPVRVPIRHGVASAWTSRPRRTGLPPTLASSRV